jgi:hypothetical protein
VANVANLLPSWLFGVLDGVGEEIRGDKGSTGVEFLRGRPRTCFRDMIKISIIVLRKLRRGIIGVLKIISQKILRIL